MPVSRRPEREHLPKRLAGASEEIDEPAGFCTEGAYPSRSGERSGMKEDAAFSSTLHE